MSGSGGKGYVMRIKLPKGTKGIDIRASQVLDGKQSEFMLPPNSQIRVKKIDHVNQILECEYILPKSDTITRPDGSAVTVTSEWSDKKIIEKVVRDKNGKIIFRDKIKL